MRTPHSARSRRVPVLVSLAIGAVAALALLLPGHRAYADGIGISVSMHSSSASTSLFTLALSARGGTAPYTWSIVEGALPAGLMLLPTGEVAGTPQPLTAPATFTVRVVDAGGQSAESRITVGTGARSGWLPATLQDDPMPSEAPQDGIEAMCAGDLSGEFGVWARPLCDGYRHPDATEFSRYVIGSMLERLAALPAWVWGR